MFHRHARSFVLTHRHHSHRIHPLPILLIRPLHLQTTLLEESNRREISEEVSNNHGLSESQLRHQLELFSPLDVFRRIFLQLKTQNRALQINASVRRYARNTPATVNPKARFRRLRNPNAESMKLTVEMFHAQILSCQTPKDLVRLMTTAFQDDEVAKVFANEHVQHRVLKKMFLSDYPSMTLEALSAFRLRFDERGFELLPQFMQLALECAASTLHVTALKHWLEVGARRRSDNLPQSFNVLAVLRHLRTALGNAQEVDKNAILACLYGFQDTSVRDFTPLTAHIDYRSIASSCELYELLADLNAPDQLLQEWHKGSEILDATFDSHTRSSVPSQRLFNVPLSFTKAFFKIGMPDLAWTIFRKYGNVMRTDAEMWSLAFKNVHSMPEIDPNKIKRHESELLRMLEAQLVELEGSLGLEWIRNEQDQEISHHRLVIVGTEVDVDDWFSGLLSIRGVDNGEADEDLSELHPNDPAWNEYLEKWEEDMHQLEAT